MMLDKVDCKLALMTNAKEVWEKASYEEKLEFVFDENNHYFHDMDGFEKWKEKMKLKMDIVEFGWKKLFVDISMLYGNKLSEMQISTIYV